MAKAKVATVNLGIETEQIISAVKLMPKAKRDEFIEDLLAATSPEYLLSIREARRDKRLGRTRSIQEVFGR